MFGLDDAEVQRRRRYVGDVRKEIQVRSLLIVQAVATLTSYVSLELEGRTILINVIPSATTSSNKSSSEWLCIATFGTRGGRGSPSCLGTGRTAGEKRFYLSAE
jgi:hypothetical protein